MYHTYQRQQFKNQKFALSPSILAQVQLVYNYFHDPYPQLKKMVVLCIFSRFRDVIKITEFFTMDEIYLKVEAFCSLIIATAPKNEVRSVVAKVRNYCLIVDNITSIGFPGEGNDHTISILLIPYTPGVAFFIFASIIHGRNIDKHNIKISPFILHSTVCFYNRWTPQFSLHLILSS